MPISIDPDKSRNFKLLENKFGNMKMEMLKINLFFKLIKVLFGSKRINVTNDVQAI